MTLALPVITMSCSCLRFSTSVTRSPCSTVEFCHSPACCSERDTTSLGMAFILAENSSFRPGQILANSCQVRRPSSMAPLSSTSPSANLSPATASGPYRNAHPPCLDPSLPSGSCVTPSRDTNSMTMTRVITVLLDWFLPFRRTGTGIGDSQPCRWTRTTYDQPREDSVVGGDPAHQRDELPTFTLRQRREQALLDLVDDTVEHLKVPCPGCGDRDDVAPPVCLVDVAPHQAASFQVHLCRG